MELRDWNHPAFKRLRQEDLNIVFNNRVTDLRKIYPYFRNPSTRLLLHFSKGANWLSRIQASS